MSEKTFNIKVIMEERWIDYFCSFLKYIEYCSSIGHYVQVPFYMDGDDDFHPKFKFDIDYKEKINNSDEKFFKKEYTCIWGE